MKNGHANKNGSGQPEPPFAFIGAQFAVMTRTQILESLANDALVQSKENLAAGPIFRFTADNFRSWSKVAEPGGMFEAPEVGLRVIRLSAFSPLAISLSEEAKKRAAAEESPPNERLILLMP